MVETEELVSNKDSVNKEYSLIADKRSHSFDADVFTVHFFEPSLQHLC